MDEILDPADLLRSFRRSRPMALFGSSIRSDEAEPGYPEGEMMFCLPLENVCMIDATLQSGKGIEK